MINLMQLLLLAISVRALLKTCPNPADIQSAYVKESFSTSIFANGQKYYELGYKDATQPRICKCQTSRKRLNGTQILDDFHIECANNAFQSDLVFDLTNTTGHFIGTWNQAQVPITRFIKFPDTVVDVGVAVGADGNIFYDWVVEFQCIEVLGFVAFYAFNFYSASSSSENFEPMLRAAYNANLGRFIEDGNTIQIVSHDNCIYSQQ
jgi:hypothetical protein